ncbi:MAG: hypothetical protein V7607_2528 [Solirubrobacteraceae bacterium]
MRSRDGGGGRLRLWVALAAVAVTGAGVVVAPVSARADGWFAGHSAVDRQMIVDYLYLRSGRASVPYGGEQADRAQRLANRMSGLASNGSSAVEEVGNEELWIGQAAGLIEATHVLVPYITRSDDDPYSYRQAFVTGESEHYMFGELTSTAGRGWSAFHPSVLQWQPEGYDIFFGATVGQSPGAYLFDADPIRWFEPPCAYSGFDPPDGAILAGAESTATCLIPGTDPEQYASVRVVYPYVAEDMIRLRRPMRPYRYPEDCCSAIGHEAQPVDLGDVETALGTHFDESRYELLREEIDWALGPYGARDPLNGDRFYPFGPLDSELYGPGPSAAAPNVPECHRGDPVDCATGNFTETQSDLDLSGLGELTLARTYNAQAAGDGTAVGRFGYGWADTYGQRLVIDAPNDRVDVVGADGSTVRFYANGDGSYDRAPWVQASLTHNGDGSYDYALPDRSSLHFDASGRLLELRDRNDNAATLQYSPAGNVASVQAPGGRSIAFTYNSDGTVSSATSPGGREVHYGYDAGDLTSVTDVRGGVWHFDYDAQHRLTQLEDPRGGHTTNAYDGDDRVTTQTDRRGQDTTWAYDGETTTVTDPDGHVSQMTFAHNLPAQIVTAKDTADEATKHIVYDDDANPIMVTDGRGHDWHYTYDGAGNRMSATDPLDRETTWTYNSKRDVLTQALPSGLTTTYGHDAHGNVTSITRALSPTQDQTTTLDYDGDGNLTGRTDALNHAWTYGYNTHGDLTSATSPLGHQTTYTHDDDGLVTAKITPRGHLSGADPADFTTTYQRNEAGQPTTITDALGHDTAFGYDANGNLTSTTDADGRQTQTTYDAGDLPTAVERDDGSTLHTGYDDNGLVVSQTDGEGHETTYVRDAQGRVASVTDPNARTTNYAYDATGNRTVIGWPDGSYRQYGYDDANQLTNIWSSNQPGTVSLNYTDDGLRSTMTDDTGTSTWSYDPLDRLASSENGQGQTVGYHYDLANRLTSIDYPDALVPGPPSETPDTVDAGTVTRGYDADDRLISVQDWLSHTTAFAYNVDDALTTIERPDGTTATQTVDRNDQLTAIDDSGDDYSYSADYIRTDAGLLASATETGDGAGPDATYAHDDAARLTSSGTGNQNYSYDAADNLTQLTDASATRKQIFDDANQLTAITDASDQPVADLNYDQQGNRAGLTPTAATATSYTYDQANQLTQYDGPDAAGTGTITQTYGYNGNGLRQYTETGGTRTHDTWDESRGLPLMIQDGATSYLYGPAGSVIEQITGAGQSRYYHHDQLGSVRALTDHTGQPLATYVYTPYGSLKTFTGTATNPFQYAGQYTDPTGLQYLRARYFDPSAGQYLTRDPLKMVTRQPYEYGGDDPVDYDDPTGLILGIPGTPSWNALGTRFVGAVDGATFGATSGFRDAVGLNGALDKCSSDYRISHAGGRLAANLDVGLATGAGAAGWFAASGAAVRAIGAGAAGGFGETVASTGGRASAGQLATGVAFGALGGAAGDFARGPDAVDTAAREALTSSVAGTAASAATGTWSTSSAGTTCGC